MVMALVPALAGIDTTAVVAECESVVVLGDEHEDEVVDSCGNGADKVAEMEVCRACRVAFVRDIEESLELGE